jgi:hypothetical protein
MSLLFTIGWLIMGALTSHYAKQRNRNPYLWFVIGLLFGILGLLLVFILPSRKEEISKIVSLPPPMESEKPFVLWYYVDENDAQQGPMSEKSFLLAQQEGKIKPLSYVWNTGMEHWKRLEEI